MQSSVRYTSPLVNISAQFRLLFHHIAISSVAWLAWTPLATPKIKNQYRCKWASGLIQFYYRKSVDSKAKRIYLEYRNVAGNSVLLILRYTLGNPYNITDFLLLQFNICIEGAKMELLLPCEAVQEHFVCEKLVFHSRFADSLIKENPVLLEKARAVSPQLRAVRQLNNTTFMWVTYGEDFASSLYLINIIGCCKGSISFWEQSTNVWI